MIEWLKGAGLIHRLIKDLPKVTKFVRELWHDYQRGKSIRLQAEKNREAIKAYYGKDLKKN